MILRSRLERCRGRACASLPSRLLFHFLLRLARRWTWVLGVSLGGTLRSRLARGSCATIKSAPTAPFVSSEMYLIERQHLPNQLSSIGHRCSHSVVDLASVSEEFAGTRVRSMYSRSLAISHNQRSVSVNTGNLGLKVLKPTHHLALLVWRRHGCDAACLSTTLVSEKRKTGIPNTFGSLLCRNIQCNMSM